MKKNIVSCIVMVFVMLCLAGCQHKAAAMQEDGVWGERCSLFRSDDSGETEVRLAFGVYKDMTDEDMLEVLDYYKKEILIDDPDNGKGIPCAEDEITVLYARFYKENTYEVLKDIKYSDEKSQSLTKEDESIFQSLDLDVKSSEAQKDEEDGVSGDEE